MSPTARRFAIIALVLCLAIGILGVTSPLWLRWMGEYLTAAGAPCKADIIVVLAGDYWGNRVLKAGELQREGWAPKVLVSGAGWSYGVNEGDLAIQFAVHHGYSPDAFISVPSSARSTQSEAESIVPDLRKRGVHRFILVTSNYHTHRAADIYRKVATGLPFCVVASTDPDFSPDGWWHSREGRKTAFFEWCKTIAHFTGI